MSSQKFNPQDVVEVLEFEYNDKVNRHLAKGWVLLGVYSIQYSDHGFCPRYSVGWIKQNGQVQYPVKTEHELRMEKFAYEDKDFPS
ncbi:hypothetical protein [Halomonas denitrificans]|uniref:hypothetical protein n=1 Tax=Halomonas denitrificans TaxID=370769 RepID=UPI0013008AAA|nr:hypothetical protein [Halomonas denitrificans]